MEAAKGELRTPRVFGLTIDPDEVLPRDTYRFGPELAPEERVIALARALASSPGWADVEDGLMVVRTQRPMGIALIGRFDPTEAARVEWLPGQLASELPRFRYVPWARIEEDCAVLGARLEERFGSTDVRALRYEAVPRGGYIVLGVLSYVLGLKHDRLTGPRRDGEPVVVVDDVALTGLRFGEVLRRYERNPVIFAPLYSHPDLRAAIRQREPRVVDVISARDLTDFAPQIMGDGYEAWRKRWMQRADGACYWVGRPEHLCFPWSEPDFTVWNPVAGRDERGWRVAPPSAVLKSRSTDVEGAAVQVQPRSSGPMRVSERTFHGELEGDVVVANLDTEAVVRLTDVAADIWRVVARSGHLGDAVRALADRYDADLGVLHADAEALVEDLIGRGLLTRASAEPVG